MEKAKFYVSDFMQALMDFEAFAVQSEFIRVFGEDRGPSLWADFTGKCGHNTTIFYRMLDERDRYCFNNYLERSQWLETVKYQ